MSHFKNLKNFSPTYHPFPQRGAPPMLRPRQHRDRYSDHDLPTSETLPEVAAASRGTPTRAVTVRENYVRQWPTLHHGKLRL